MIKLSKTAAVLVGFMLAVVGMCLWAQQPDDSLPGRRARPRPQRATQPAPKAPAERQARPAYVVEPPDLVIVEVLEALPGRPISGERLVRPDGCISLGFYGEIPVAGLTLPQIKEKIVLHLRKFIGDELLGLVVTDPETEKVIKKVSPRDTDRVFVEVTSYNSAMMYVEGDVVSPGRIAYTGGDSVLDLIHHSGGLLPSADRTRIRLVRSFPKGSPARVLPVDYEEITMGTDSSTNYPTLPNDRLVVPSDPSYATERVSDEDPPSQRRHADMSDLPAGKRQDDPGTEKSDYIGRKLAPPREVEGQSELEHRVSEIERKLDKLIELMEDDKGKPEGRSSKTPVAVPTERDPFDSSLVAPAGRDPFQIDEEKPVARPSKTPDAPPPDRNPFEMVPQSVQKSEPDSVPRSERRARSPARSRDTIPRHDVLRPAPGRMVTPRARREVPRPSPGGGTPPAKVERPSERPQPPSLPQARSPLDNVPPEP